MLLASGDVVENSGKPHDPREPWVAEAARDGNASPNALCCLGRNFFFLMFTLLVRWEPLVPNARTTLQTE